jgi:nucleotide-binding universal stress UspA family protein
LYRILVPLDGSKLAERAIAWADALAGPLDADVELTAAVLPSSGSADAALISGLTVESSEQQIAALRAMLELEAEYFTNVRPGRLEVLTGTPGEAISSHAQAKNVDLIVMSSHGRGDLERAFLGSVADEVIRNSRVPVLVIRGEVTSPMVELPTTIMVPLDGSELSGAILPHVKPIAHTLGSQLVLFWQVDWQPETLATQGPSIPLDALAAGGHADMAAYLERTAADLNAAGIATDVRVWFGNQPESIARFAEQERFGLIAMSTHGRHGFGRWLRGSVTDHILAHTTIPLLTVRP